MDTNGIKGAGPQLVQPKKKAIKGRTNNPQILPDVLGHARITRSLTKTCDNLGLTESAAAFYMCLQLADQVLARRDGYGAVVRKGPGREEALGQLRAIGRVA